MRLGDRVCATYCTPRAADYWFCIGFSDLGFANNLRQEKSQVEVINEARGKNTGHGFRLPPEIAADRRGFPAANETRDLYTADAKEQHSYCGLTSFSTGPEYNARTCFCEIFVCCCWSALPGLQETCLTLFCNIISEPSTR